MEGVTKHVRRMIDEYVGLDEFDYDGQKIKLFAPGPVYVPPEILAEMAKPNDTHRCKSYSQLHRMLREKIQRLLGTKNDVLFFTGTGSLAMEACVRNFSESNKNGMGSPDVVLLITGKFGERWADMHTDNDHGYYTFTFEDGKPADISAMYRYQQINFNNVFSLNPEKLSVFVTMNESSTGVITDIKAIRKSIGPEPLLIVDAVSCMSGTEIKMDEWGIDVCFASTQKCFGVPCGIAVCAVSDRAFDRAADIPNRGWNTDFLRMQKASRKDCTPATCNLNCLRALNKALDMIEEEGYQARYDRHLELSKQIRVWVVDNGFELYANSNAVSPTITVIKNTRNIDVNAVISEMLKRGYRFANGYGDLAQKTFRIGAMGWVVKQELTLFLNTLTEVLLQMYPSTNC